VRSGGASLGTGQKAGMCRQASYGVLQALLQGGGRAAHLSARVSAGPWASIGKPTQGFLCHSWCCRQILKCSSYKYSVETHAWS